MARVHVESHGDCSIKHGNSGITLLAGVTTPIPLDLSRVLGSVLLHPSPSAPPNLVSSQLDELRLLTSGTT